MWEVTGGGRGMCPWGKCPGSTCPGGFCPVTVRVLRQWWLVCHWMLRGYIEGRGLSCGLIMTERAEWL